MVTVLWEGLCFNYRLQSLEMDEEFTSLSATCHKFICLDPANEYRILASIRLSKKDLAMGLFKFLLHFKHTILGNLKME